MPHGSSEILKYQSNGLAWMTFTSRSSQPHWRLFLWNKDTFDLKGIGRERKLRFYVCWVSCRLPCEATCRLRSLFPIPRLASRGAWATNFPKKQADQQTFQKNGKQADQQSTRLLMQAISHRKWFKISQTNAATVKTLRCVKRFNGKSMERAPLAP